MSVETQTPTMPKIKAADFKIHASGAHDILAGEIGLTDNQMKEFKEWETKLKAGGTITAKQGETYAKYKQKLENPELPAGAKTVCKNWVKEQLFGRKKVFSSKYTEKGNLTEQSSFAMIARHLAVAPFSKNDEMFDDDHFIGTPDVNEEDFGLDAKNPWDCFTFPLFEDELKPEYNTQGQVYMALCSKQEWIFAYCLSNTPKNILIQEARKHCTLNGLEFGPEIVAEFEEQYNYDHLPEELRVKTYTIQRDDAVIAELRRRVEMCRKYIDTIIPDYARFKEAA